MATTKLQKELRNLGRRIERTQARADKLKASRPDLRHIQVEAVGGRFAITAQKRSETPFTREIIKGKRATRGKR